MADVASASEVEEAWGDELRPEAREVIVTLAERLREEGRREGLDALRRVLLRQLRVRFGEVSTEVEARIRAGA